MSEIGLTQGGPGGYQWIYDETDLLTRSRGGSPYAYIGLNPSTGKHFYFTRVVGGHHGCEGRRNDVILLMTAEGALTEAGEAYQRQHGCQLQRLRARRPERETA